MDDSRTHERAERQISPTNATTASDRERIRAEFYASYDVMTGVRIAATLGGFFLFMVIIIFYKSRSKFMKALKDPKIVELAEAVVAEEVAAEEELHLTAALEDAIAERVRDSLGELPPWPRTSRLSSFGSGYSTLAPTPRRLSAIKRDSLPTSSLRSNLEDSYRRRLLRDRRLSSMTCSSSGSSYLERRGSSMACTLPERRLSPCPSEHEGEGVAPLASIGSVGFSIEVETESGGPDSVFAAGSAPSTDDEIEQFSTDSGENHRHLRSKSENTELIFRKPPVEFNLENVHNSRETFF